MSSQRKSESQEKEAEGKVARFLLFSRFLLHLFKGTVPRDFWLQVFLWISFPQAPEYTTKAVSNFFENSRRYSQLKVHYRDTGVVGTGGKWEKSVIRKSFKYFLLHLWVEEFNIQIFSFKVTLWCQQSDICPIICHRCRWYRWFTLTCEHLREFLKNLKETLMLFSGAWGKRGRWFRRKSEAKNLVTLSL